jgi:hypothetical protein
LSLVVFQTLNISPELILQEQGQGEELTQDNQEEKEQTPIYTKIQFFLNLPIYRVIGDEVLHVLTRDRGHQSVIDPFVQKTQPKNNRDAQVFGTFNLGRCTECSLLDK